MGEKKYSGMTAICIQKRMEILLRHKKEMTHELLNITCSIDPALLDKYKDIETALSGAIQEEAKFMSLLE